MKSVEDVISVLWEPIQASRDQYSTLFDVVPADKTGKPVNFNKYVKQNDLTRYIDKSLLDNWNSVGMNKLLPVQVKAIEAGYIQREPRQNKEMELKRDNCFVRQTRYRRKTFAADSL